MNLIVVLLKNKHLLFELIKNDFKKRYLGNYLGSIWAFIQPIVTVAVYWFVFTQGFKATPVDNFPFLLWLLCGMVPWFLINEAVMTSANSIMDNVFLVKKIVFEIKLLPFVKLGSAILVNSAFFLFMVICFLFYGYKPSWYWLQLIYYYAACILLLFGLSLIFSSVIVFVRDISQILAIIMQLLFWLTPIFWNILLIHNFKLQVIIKANPFYYIINGFRDSLIYNIPFWQRYWLMLYFWLMTFFIIWVGNIIFNKLRPHFADVL